MLKKGILDLKSEQLNHQERIRGRRGMVLESFEDKEKGYRYPRAVRFSHRWRTFTCLSNAGEKVEPREAPYPEKRKKSPGVGKWRPTWGWGEKKSLSEEKKKILPSEDLAPDPLVDIKRRMEKR